MIQSVSYTHLHLAGEIMKALGCTYDEKQVGMFLWGKIPASCKDVEELTEKVLQLYSESKQLMVDMILVRQELVLPVAYPMQVDSDHVAARNQQG